MWFRGLILLLLTLGPASAAAQASLVFVAASPVPPGKFVLLQQLAEPLGLRLRVQFAEKLPPDAGPALWDGADLVIVDAPRDHVVEYVRRRLGKALPALAGRPHVWMAAGAPTAEGLPQPLVERLHAYYVNGGLANHRHFLQTAVRFLAGDDWAGVPEPVVFPAAGLYHPDLPSIVLPDLASYLAWRGVDTRAGGRAPPMVAIAFHQQSIAAGQTALIDDLVRRVEAGGAVALPFYQPVMDNAALAALLTLDGRVLADVIVNTQITLDPEGRRALFEQLGRPVIQATAYRRGSAEDWRADPQGVQTTDVPFYLAQAEFAGITDIQIAAATRREDDQLEPIAGQAAAVAAKALNVVKLRRTPAADKRVAIMFWNYPSGEKNLSASFMNLPRSLVATLGALRWAGYRTETADETMLTLLLQRLLAPGYRPPQDEAVLESLLRDGLAARLPLAEYRAWLATLPATVRDALQQRWGDPARSAMVLRRGGEAFFVVPRLQLGQVTLLPQPGRSERGDDKEKSLYHSSNAIPPHHYLAAYLWLRGQADALVHFGTHGTQEWLPGKERGLSVHDWPMLAVGDLPVAYPYIVDNVGEATQAKRRGRAVTISHQTPPLVPAGLHERLTHIHDLLHDWLAAADGGVREQIRAQFLAAVRAENIHRDMGWDEARIGRGFESFVDAVHDHLHELALSVQPLGLHTFGRGSGDPGRLATVLMMLGKDYWEGVAGPGEEADEMLIEDHRRLAASRPYRLLRDWVLDGKPIPGLEGLKPEVRQRLADARRWYEWLGAEGELRGLLAVLAGEHVPTSYGGDPVRNPDALPTGRNLYGFDPSRVPTRAAWEAGKLAMDELLAAHREQQGRTPAKLALTLWSVETMRHFGLLEAQALWAMGVEPVWDRGGRVTDVRLIPREQLGRPRVDVVLSATGLYRDHFPNAMRQLARAARLAAEADEADNPVAANARRIAAQLRARGVADAAATAAGQTRIFSSASGEYGSGLDQAAVATDTWKTQAEADRKLADLYLRRMQYAYGPDESTWGQPGAAGRNLYAEQLRGTEGAVLSRSSNLYGMLTTDDPFQYLGGIALAVRHLDGKAPALYISNLRAGGAGKVEGAAGFLAKELATRNFHPGYLGGLMAEGYAGTLQMLDGIVNFAGWQGVAREIVRHDQWDGFMDVYVRDKHALGLQKWFRAHNPHALAQMMERMLEAARQGQWAADPARVAELRDRYRELAKRYDVRSDNAAFEAFVGLGYGLQAAASRPASVTVPPVAPVDAPVEAVPAPVPPPTPEPAIEGLLLERQPELRPPAPPPLAWPALALLMLAGTGGAWRARRV